MIPFSCRSLLVLLLIFNFTGLLTTVRAQESSRMRFVHWTYQDIASLPGDLRPHHALYALGGTAIIGGLSLLDKSINHELEEGYRGIFATYVDITNELGGPSAKLPVAALFTTSLFTRNVRFQDASFTSLQALVYSFSLNQGIKFIAGRVRPEDTSNPHQFEPFSGNSSFPSGHASSAFAVLTPWALYYRHPISYALLIVGGGGTALSRISREKHWFTDVLAGSAQGFLTAYWLTRRHQRIQGSNTRQLQVWVAPAIYPNATSLTFHATF